MVKIIFVIVAIIVLSSFIGYLSVGGMLNGLFDVFTNLPTFLRPFITIYNVVISYPNTMIFIMAFLGAQIIRYVFYKLGVYGND